MAIQKLRNEYSSLDKNSRVGKAVPIEPIFQYLCQKCGTDYEFSAAVVNDSKSLMNCFNHVYNKVKEELNGKNKWIEDKVVYGFAEEYYLTNIYENTEVLTPRTPTVHKPKPVEEPEIQEQSLFDF